MIAYTYAHSPKWSDSGHTCIELMVNFTHCGLVPFSCMAADTEHGQEIFNKAIAGEFGVIAEYVAPPVPVPQLVSRFQGMAALLQMGVLDDVDAYMALETTDPLEKLAWRDIQEFRRSSPLLLKVGTMLSLSEAQIDDLFRFAATIYA